jgi:DNA-binding response OmpR family regulator
MRELTRVIYEGASKVFDLLNRFSFARILVVDDSVFDRRIISIALKKAGFKKILTADDGAEAVQKTYDFRPDLVILDLKMPNLDGFGYCEMVRNDNSLPRMPIIVQTGMKDRQSWMRALSCGADDFLTKPLDMEELTLRICVHAERYFMLRDLEDTCSYLKMELDISHNLRGAIEKSGMSPSKVNTLSRHFEVLEQIVHASAHR